MNIIIFITIVVNVIIIIIITIIIIVVNVMMMIKYLGTPQEILSPPLLSPAGLDKVFE